MKFGIDKDCNIVYSLLKFCYCRVNSFWIISKKNEIINFKNGMRALKSPIKN